MSRFDPPPAANNPSAIVCLSGGMDSTAALMWARRRYPRVLAVLFDYGQPNRDQELPYAGHVCVRFGIQRTCIMLGESVPRGRGILHHIEEHDGREDGQSPATVTGRNGIFAVSAAAHGAEFFPNGNIVLVFGCNAQDARRFPDCHPSFFLKLGELLRTAIAREIQVVAPWITSTKAQILEEVRGYGDEPALDAVRKSWSCYRADGPCGRCSACCLRTDGFRTAGMADECARRDTFGGNQHRCS